MVNCPADYTEQPKVINGASDVFVQVFGKEKGAHARAAVGVVALPLGGNILKFLNELFFLGFRSSCGN